MLFIYSQSYILTFKINANNIDIEATIVGNIDILLNRTESLFINSKINIKYPVDAKAVARGIIWAVNHGADIINISLQFTQSSLELEKAVNYAWGKGVVVVAAAGSNRGTQLTYPASYGNCIAVTATKQDDTLAPLSNYGD